MMEVDRDDKAFRDGCAWLGWILLRDEYFDFRRLTSYGWRNRWALDSMHELELEGDYFEVGVRHRPRDWPEVDVEVER